MPVNLTPPTLLPAIDGVRLGSTRAIKSRKRDDLLVVELAAGTTVSALFTRNRFAAAPVVVCRKHLTGKNKATNIRALAINAGIANAGTAGTGLRDAEESCRLLAKSLDCKASQILPFSTGVIMELLPMARYADGLNHCIKKLHSDNWLAAASAIMTTDTVAKGTFRQTNGKTITGIAKGSGMIHPNMATMLAFVATDAAIPADTLHRWHKQIAAETFNAISVDGDTSTNDSFVIMATGKAAAPRGRTETAAVKHALMEVSEELSEAIVRDGEGAGKLITIRVSGGKSRAICRKVADSIARSPLVKTAFAASDANVGRLLMAIGNAGDGFETKDVCLHIADIPVIKNGGEDPKYSEAAAAAALAKAEVTLSVRIGNGNSAAHLKTCDLTHGYIDINASYRS